MATLPPHPRLKDVENAANFMALVQDNFEIIAAELALRQPSYVNGVPTTIIGPPTSGAHLKDEFWRDAQARTCQQALRRLVSGLWQNRAHRGPHEDLVGQNSGLGHGDVVSLFPRFGEARFCFSGPHSSISWSPRLAICPRLRWLQPSPASCLR
jgi:hypothetical protein